MITALDTSVLLDVLANDPKHVDRSEALLLQAYRQGSLIISPAVYAELVPQARHRDELDGWLQQVRIRVPPFRPTMRTRPGLRMRPIARLVARVSGFWPIFLLVHTPFMKLIDS